MKIRIPTNTDIDGNALCIKACYFKNAAISTLTSWMWGGVPLPRDGSSGTA